ncbi:hypothetical protein [Vibrio navarrensis]|uniref:hypothetical protein n=1 Tax=Vibrio navarrensis TaxID=29495 RepID=UPI00192F4E51|nr:hypothetical protein [Vibrio navarrensis]
MIDLKLEEDEAHPNEYYQNEPTIDSAWLYIAIDIRDMRMVKVGLTTRENPHDRILNGRTYNPFVTLFAAYDLTKNTFGISKKELADMESRIHGRGAFGEPLRHLNSGRRSEWFFIDPDEAEFQIDVNLAKRGFSVDGYMLFTHQSGYEKYNDIAIWRMKRIKSVFKPKPLDFKELADSRGIPFEIYKPYYEYLVAFHGSGNSYNQAYRYDG